LLGTSRVGTAESELAARLVLAPKAQALPPVEEEPEPDAPDAPPPEPQDPQDPQEAPPEDPETADRAEAQAPPEEMLLEAARAAIPQDILARLAAAGSLRRASPGAGAGGDTTGARHGRPMGPRPGDPRSGARLDLVATLRTAAPWQPVRRRLLGHDPGHVLVTREDFRIRRFRQKTEKVVIFALDASGSAAMTRLAETKGAIELMLAEAYVRREQVAMIAFRGTGAELLLPPTRALVQAKRRLGALPGGGGTPLAAGLEAALVLADQVRRKGQSAHLVLLTDGRANIARDGQPGRGQAGEDALSIARRIRAAAIPVILVDTAPRPQPPAQALAAELGGAYLALPHADAQVLNASIRSAMTVPGGGGAPSGRGPAPGVAPGPTARQSGDQGPAKGGGRRPGQGPGAALPRPGGGGAA